MTTITQFKIITARNLRLLITHHVTIYYVTRDTITCCCYGDDSNYRNYEPRSLSIST